jgi:hypothetical protein
MARGKAMIEVVRRPPPGHHLLQNGECAHLVALRQGRPVFSVLTGVDRRFCRLTGERQGWFSRLEGEDDPEAASAVLAEAAAFQKGLGMERLIGPDAPSGRFQPGILAEGERSTPHLDRLLRENGFDVLRESAAFSIPVGALKGLGRAAARAREAHGVLVRREGFSKASCRAVYGLYEPRRLPFEEFAQVLSQMRPLEAYLASVRGRDAGFALARPEGGTWRVETVMIAPGFQRGPALICLLDALASRLGPGVRTGSIDPDNAPSLAVIRALGGRECERWRVYVRYLI